MRDGRLTDVNDSRYDSLWCIPRGAVSPEFLSILSPGEREQADAIESASRKAAFIRGRAALRLLLSRAVGFDADCREWRFSKNAFGKTCIDPGGGLPEIEFSISHTAQATAIVLSRRGPVGIDIEPDTATFLRCIPWEIAVGIREQSDLERYPIHERWRYFLRLWTAKEAYAKYLGQNLSLDFSGIYVSLDDETIYRREAFGHWTPEEFSLYSGAFETRGEKFIFALAAAPPKKKPPSITIVHDLKLLLPRASTMHFREPTEPIRI